MAKDGEVALRFNLDWGESLIFLGSHGGQVAHPMIQAHVAIVPGSEVRICPVPAAMAMTDSPLQGLSRHADSVALVSTAAALAALLGVNEATEPTRKA